MKIESTILNGVFKFSNVAHQDNRGAFARLFCQDSLREAIGNRKISQINYSKTNKVGIIRGMHYQLPPFSELKIVRCLTGSVFDVVVDLRSNSKTFLQWIGVELSEDSSTAIVIPEGCAHGFQCLQENSELLYLHTAAYTPESERGIRFDDPSIKIQWPKLPVDVSSRDMSHEFIGKNFKGVIL